MLEKGEISIRDTNLRKNVNKKEKSNNERRNEKKAFPYAKTLPHRTFPFNPPPRIHSHKLPKQKSHGEAQFGDEKNDVDEAKDWIADSS